MIKLYDKTYNTLLGTLNSIIEANIEEERNGLFELSFTMLNTDSLFKYIDKENIVVCNANDTLLNQKFRIYNIRKLMSNRVEVYARHISFDLMYDYISDISIDNQSCEYVLNQLFRNSNFSNSYRGYSDIVNTQNYSISNVPLLSAIAGSRGSIIDTFGNGADILRDNENIHVLSKRGHDNSVTIEYRKNLTGLELEEDTTDLVTRILPYAKYTPEGGEEITVKANYVDSPYINNFSHPYISSIDYSDKFEDGEIPTTEKLIEFAKLEYTVNKVDIPKQNYKIEFIPLSKCVGYEALNDKISLCDTVTIKDTRYNINTQSKVIKTVFNVLKNRYESIELGEPKTTLGDIISSNDDKVTEEQVKDIVSSTPSTNYPNTLPSIPNLKYFVYGFANIELSWTFENKVYYAYEVYASKTKDFTPNTFDLLYQGQASSYMFQAQPNEIWYFKVCGMNSYNKRTEFSNQVEVVTTKISDLSNYVSNMAIGEALIGTLSLDRGWIGQLNANLLDVKGNFSVTDGNGKRTFDIDSFGNISADVTSLKIKNEGVATSSQVEQTSEALKLKFEQSGGYNLLKNSAFKDGTNYWSSMRWDSTAGGTEYIEIVEPSYSDWTPANRNSLGACITGLDSNNAGKSLRCGFDCRSFNVKSNTTYSLNCLIAAHRVSSVTIEMLCYDANGNRILDDNHSVVIYDIRTGGRDRNNWAKIKHTWTTQSNAATCHLRAFMNEWNGTLGSAFMWICEPIITEGDVEIPWTPNADEIYTGITTVDSEGIKVEHENGSFSRMNNQEFYQANEDGARTAAIRYGGYRCYKPDDGYGFLGGLYSSRKANNQSIYGISYYGTKNAKYIDIAFDETLENDTQSSAIIPYIALVREPIDYREDIGIYTHKLLIVNGGIKLNSVFDINNYVLKNVSTFRFKNGSELFESTTNKICIGGAEGIYLGHNTSENTIYGTINIPGANGDTISSYKHWDFNNWTMKNMKIANSLQAQTYQLKEYLQRTSTLNEIYSTNVSDSRELRCKSIVKENTVVGELIVELPQLISENIQKDYQVHISKYGFGDYYIKERNPYYFVIVADKEFSFDWEVVATMIDNTYDNVQPYNLLSDTEYIEINEEINNYDDETILSSKYAKYE